MDPFIEELFRAGIAFAVLWLWAQGAEKRAAKANSDLIQVMTDNNARNIENLKENTRVNVEAVEVSRQLLGQVEALRNESARDHGDMRDYLRSVAQIQSQHQGQNPRG